MGRPSLLLKVATAGRVAELEAERARLEWLAPRAPVPRVLDFVLLEGVGSLLSAALPGRDATRAPAALWARVVREIARRLRRLHSMEAGACPFDRTLDVALPLAAARAASGLVDETDFDPERRGRSAEELLETLPRQRPGGEDVVVTHGDAGLSNLLFDSDRFTGFVDCGRCGRADRHQDLALAHRSIARRFGEDLAEDFLEAYGPELVDRERLSYYRLLDELF